MQETFKRFLTISLIILTGLTSVRGQRQKPLPADAVADRMISCATVETRRSPGRAARSISPPNPANVIISGRQITPASTLDSNRSLNSDAAPLVGSNTITRRPAPSSSATRPRHQVVFPLPAGPITSRKAGFLPVPLSFVPLKPIPTPNQNE